jgi:NADPH:quinone reductase-like Zn-dependent oxidoreductase
MTMRAATYDRFGGPDVVELQQVAVPEPAPGEVRVEVVAASINPVDWKLLRGDFSWLRPRISVRRLGCDFAGRVQAVGANVTAWRVGDEVFGSLEPLAGKQGSAAEFVILPAAQLARKPANLPFADAAALPIAGGSALTCLELVGARADAETLVIGASGGVGSFCVQLAKIRGARVTAVCHSRNAERVRALGAAEVIQYDREDVFARARMFDAIIDAVGVHSFVRCAPLLRSNGCYVTTVGRPADYLAVWRSKLFGGRQARALMVNVTPVLLAELAQLTQTAGLHPTIGARFPLAEVKQALALSASGHAFGKIVVEVKA